MTSERVPRGGTTKTRGYGRLMSRRTISRLATSALLVGLFVVVASAARAEQAAVHSQAASVHAAELVHPDAVLASSRTDRSPVRHAIAPATVATAVSIASPTLWVQVVAGLAVAGIVLLFTPRRRRAPPRSLFA